MLWARLRLRPFGLKFRKQHRATPYTLDFYCAERALVIEIDGEAHNRGDRPARDERRDAWCREKGMAVLRVPAADVLRDADEAAEAIARYALALPRRFDAPGRARRIPSDPLRGPPPQQVGEKLSPAPPHLDGEVARSAGGVTPPQLDGEVASRSDDGGAPMNGKDS